MHDCLDKGLNMSAGQMQDQLVLLHPNRFDTPATHNITTVVDKRLTNFCAARATGQALESIVGSTKSSEMLNLMACRQIFVGQ